MLEFEGEIIQSESCSLEYRVFKKDNLAEGYVALNLIMHLFKLAKIINDDLSPNDE